MFSFLRPFGFIKPRTSSPLGASGSPGRITDVSLRFPLPPLQEQTRIVEHLDALSARIQALEKTSRERIDHLAALKASLLDAAFRGEL